jgi:hypothetical protein
MTTTLGSRKHFLPIKVALCILLPACDTCTATTPGCYQILKHAKSIEFDLSAPGGEFLLKEQPRNAFLKQPLMRLILQTDQHR